MATGFGSQREQADRQTIHQNTQVGKDPITGDKIMILPVFNVHDTKTIVGNRHVKILESDYLKHTFSIRKIYVAFDIGPDNNIIDPRPFVYAGDPGAAYSPKNKKIRIAHSIKGLSNNSHYTDEQLMAIKTDPCGYLDNNMDNLVPHNIIVNNSQIKKQIKLVSNNMTTNSSQNRTPIDISNKIKKTITIHNNSGTILLMESLVMKGFKPTSLDAINDKEFRYLGVSKKTTKQDDRWIATCKGQNLGTYSNPVDAARAYNDFVIDSGLPYPVNNIPGFLKTKFVGYKERFMTSFETWELANEVARRLMPDEAKF